MHESSVEEKKVIFRESHTKTQKILLEKFSKKEVNQINLLLKEKRNEK